MSEESSNKREQQLNLRPATLQDLSVIEKLNIIEDFDMGLHNLDLYFRTSPSLWEVVENENKEIVGLNISHLMSNGLIMGFATVVREDYRGRGVSRVMTAMERTPGPYIGYATADSLERYHYDCYEFSLVQYYGMVTPKLVPAACASSAYRIVAVTEANFEQVMRYDCRIIKIDRTKFMHDYMLPKDTQHATAVVAISEDNLTENVVGFAVLRRMSNFYQISPCYAETPEVARNLLLTLASYLKLGDLLYMPTPAFSAAGVQVAHEIRLGNLGSEVRVCSKGAEVFSRRIDWKKICTVHDYWPV